MNSSVRRNLHLSIIDAILLSRIINLPITYRRDKFKADATTICYNGESITIVTMFHRRLSDDDEGYNPFSPHHSGIIEGEYYNDRDEVVSIRMFITENKIIILGKSECGNDMNDEVITLNKIRDDYWIGTNRCSVMVDLYITKIEDDVINVIKTGDDYIITDGLNTVYFEDGQPIDDSVSDMTDNMTQCYLNVLHEHN